jgi:hypothetical protein
VLLPLAVHPRIATARGRTMLAGRGQPVEVQGSATLTLELVVSREHDVPYPSAVAARQRLAAKAAGLPRPDAASELQLEVMLQHSPDGARWVPLHRFNLVRTPGGQRVMMCRFPGGWLRATYVYARSPKAVPGNADISFQFSVMGFAVPEAE